MRRSSILISFLFLAAACGSDLPASPEAGAPLIVTSSLPDAVYDGDYVLQIQWSGGRGPFTFSADIPRSLAWLSIDETTGILTGRPDGLINPGVEVMITVTDAVGQSDTKPLTLAVTKCNDEGRRVDCFTVDTQNGKCVQGTALCSGGTFADCEPSKASQDLDHCGTNLVASACGSCSAVTANSCDGTCKCGSGPSCVGASPVCCNGQCVSSTGDDPNDCGGCGTVCPAGPANSSPTCSSGECGWSCNGSYSLCETSCIDLTNNVSNCGECGKTCAVANAPAGATCSGGGCLWPGVVYAESGLNIRSGPSSATARVGGVALNATVHIDCQIRGETVEGTNLWDYIIAENGHPAGYVTDNWIRTGTLDQFAPTCQ